MSRPVKAGLLACLVLGARWIAVRIAISATGSCTSRKNAQMPSSDRLALGVDLDLNKGMEWGDFGTSKEGFPPRLSISIIFHMGWAYVNDLEGLE